MIEVKLYSDRENIDLSEYSHIFISAVVVIEKKLFEKRHTKTLKTRNRRRKEIITVLGYE